MIRENRKLPKDVEKRIPQLVQNFGSDKDIVALYLFGSLAQDELKPLSDLDFGVLLNDKMEKKGHFDKHLQLIGLFTDALRTDEIDLILMNDVPNHLSYEIIRTGKLLLCNDRRFLIDFREKLVMSYLDFKFVRNEFDSVFLKGVGYHG